MQADWLSWVAEALNDPAVQLIAEIQPLWSGYGTCARIYSPIARRNLVAKVVMPKATTRKAGSLPIVISANCTHLPWRRHFTKIFSPGSDQAVPQRRWWRISVAAITGYW